MSSPDSENTPDVVRKRQVYYVHGFDARGARFYHPLYREGAAAQDVVNGTRVSVGNAEASGAFAVSWDVRAQCAEADVFTRYTFLRWEDMVKAHWLVPKFATVVLTLQFYAAYIGSGAMGRLWKCSRRYTASVLSTLFFGFLAASVALVVAWATAATMGHFVPAWGMGGQWSVGVLAGLLLMVGAVEWSERLRLLWLARAWIFVHSWGHRNSAAIESRWRVFAQHIASDAGAVEADEVLLIGHSAGSWAVISVLAELLALPQGRALLPKLRLMTLGQVVPMMSLCAHAHAFRNDVKTVVESGVPWLDFTAPSDPICTALVSPLDGAGVENADSAVSHVVVRSARFDNMFSPAKFKRLSADPFRIHFQYLMATDLPVFNDYFSITAGPRSLRHWMVRQS